LCHRGLHVVAVKLLVLSVCGCSPGTPFDGRPGGYANPIAGFWAASGGAASGPSGGIGGPRPPMGGSGSAAGGTFVGVEPTAGTGGPTGGDLAIAGGGSTGVAGSSGMPMAQVPFDAGSDPNRNMVGPGALCARAAMIQCAGEAHCCTNRTRTTEACRAAVMMVCSQQLYLDQIAMNPITNFDATATASAFGQLEQKASQCDISIAAWAGSDAGLRGILKGTVAPGASCKPSQNLTDPPTAGAALASCTNITTTACLPKSLLGDWTCAPKNSAGGACATDNNCVTGTSCSNPTMKFLATCADLLPLGAACTDGSQCSSLFCKSGVCVAASQQVAYCP
jgi:hypothetical protein